MIKFASLTAALNGSLTPREIVNALVDNRAYTFGDRYGYAVSGSQEGVAYPITEGSLLRFANVSLQAMIWPSHLITVSVDGVSTLGITIGWPHANQAADFIAAVNAVITVEEDDPLYGLIHRDTDSTLQYTKGMVIARILGYDDYVIIKHQPTHLDDTAVVSSTGATYNIWWIWDTVISSDNVTGHAYQSLGHGLDSDGTRPFCAYDGGLITDMCHVMTDEQNFNDLAMTRAMITTHDTAVNAAAITTNAGAIQDEAAARLAADRALSDAFYNSTAFGTKIATLVEKSAVIDQYIPRP